MILDLYEMAMRPASLPLRRTDPQVAHDRTVGLMRAADRFAPAVELAQMIGRASFPAQPRDVGGVGLPHRLIVAAGLVKGLGFDDEAQAMAAVRGGQNVVPGWRSVAALAGPVEYGSFTRYPRLGNPGRVLFRDNATESMQNRVGLRNPGARAGAAYLARHAHALPPTWGLSLAVSPGAEVTEHSRDEIAEAATIFAEAFAGLGSGPAWLTLNLSCPNTEDDPGATQTAELADALTEALTGAYPIPLWVKIGPDLSEEQLRSLVTIFAKRDVRAVIAANTWAQPVPEGSATAGVSGARLRPLALRSVRRLRAIIDDAATELDVVASGGIMRGADLRAFEEAGARAAMVYSALVFRGPLAGALILREAPEGGARA